MTENDDSTKELSPLHLSLQARKTLEAKTAFIRAFEQQRARLATLGLGELVNAVEQLLHAKVNRQLSVTRQSANTDSLDTYISQLLPEILDRLNADTDDVRVADALKEVRDRLATEFSRVNCHSCCRGQHLCDGTEQDHNIVHEYGHCIAWIHRFQRRIESHARVLYALASNNTPIDVVMSTADSGIPERDMPSGVTHVGDDAGQLRSDVKLILPVRRFGAAAFEAVPYVLAHEYLVHAFQGVVGTDRPRRPSEPDDMFSEGWMDYVAYVVLDDLYRRYPDDWPAQTMDRAAQRRLERKDTSTGDATAACRHLGDQAARTVHVALQQVHANHVSALARFVQFSVSLNARWSSSGEFDVFLWDLRKLLAADAPNRFLALEAIDRYGATLDVDALFGAVTQLTNRTGS